jgi:hypothetical protein
VTGGGSRPWVKQVLSVSCASVGGNVVIADCQRERWQQVQSEGGRSGGYCRRDCKPTRKSVKNAISSWPFRSVGGLQGTITLVGYRRPRRKDSSARKGPHNTLASFVARGSRSTSSALFMWCGCPPLRWRGSRRPQAGRAGVVVNTASVAAYDGQIGAGCLFCLPKDGIDGE